MTAHEIEQEQSAVEDQKLNYEYSLILSVHMPEGYSSYIVCRSVNIGSQRSLGF